MMNPWIAGLSALLLSTAPALEAAPRLDPAAGAFGRLTKSLSKDGKALFCGFVADQAAENAAEAPEAEVRAARAAEAARLQARLAPLVAAANARLTPEQKAANKRDHGQMMGLLSYAPSPELAQAVKAQPGVDIIPLFLADVAGRCDAMLDKMRVPPAPAVAPTAATAFRWEGQTVQQWFEGTPLLEPARRLCAGETPGAEDFAAVPLAQRGRDGISLLDWAMACEDRAGFAALLEAGHNVDAPGAFDRQPVTRAIEKADRAYLRALLAKGAKPDVMGRIETALATSYDPRRPDGGEAFVMLRAAGASLNFPDYDRSMWERWAMFAKWEEILNHWEAFDSDAVMMGRSLSRDLERPDTRGSKAALEELKGRLETRFGVCFPVNALIELTKDARGYYVQPDCPRP